MYNRHRYNTARYNHGLFLKYFVAGITAGITVIRQPAKIISRLVSAKGGITTTIQKILAVKVSATGFVGRFEVVAKIITGAVRTSASMIRHGVVEKVLLAGLTVSTTWVKQINKNVVRVVSTKVPTKKDITKTMTSKAAVIPKFINIVQKSLQAFVSIVSAIVKSLFGSPEFMLLETAANFVVIESPPGFELRETLPDFVSKELKV